MSNANANMHTEMTAVEGKTAVTPKVSVINPDSVERSKSLHFMLTMLVEGPALDIIFNTVDRVKVTSPGGDWSWNTILVPGCVQQAP